MEEPEGPPPPRPIQTVRTEYKNDIYADDFDATLTPEFLEKLPYGQMFPDIKGVATVNYAHAAFPTLPLKEAVLRYLEQNSRRAAVERTRPPPPKRIYDVIKQISCDNGHAILVRSWDDYRSGRLLAIVEQRMYHATFCPPDKRCVLADTTDAFNPSQEQAQEISRNIVVAVQSAYADRAGFTLEPSSIHALMFSGPVCFVSCASNTPHDDPVLQAARQLARE